MSSLQDRYELEDGTVLVITDTFQPTERFDGGTLFRVKELEGETIGYTVVVGDDGQSVFMLDRDGDPIEAPLSASQIDELAADRGVN